MNHKIKIMNKQQAISDEEIRSFMDFDGLVLKASQMTSLAKMLSNLKVITGGIVAVSVSVSVFLFWVGQPDKTTPPGQEAPTEQSAPEPQPAKAPAIDSIMPLKEIPEQKLPSLKVQPKKNAVTVREEKVAPSKTAPAMVYHEAEPVEGFTHLYEYFHTELKYPEEAVEDSIQGVVTVTFIINSQGKIGTIKLSNSLGPAFDAEAIRLVERMPAWRPATIDGKPVPSKFSLPVTFQFKQ